MFLFTWLFTLGVILIGNAEFSIQNDSFAFNNTTFKILAGSIHYQRIVPAYWEDRLDRAKAMGLNTITTYVPWNIHERQKGEFNFEGFADLSRFIELVQSRGMFMILRPGPYICGEWDFGGFPAWLLANGTIELRTYSQPYIQHVEDWFGVLLPLVKKYLHENGGPILMVQVENEYGSYGDVTKNSKDKIYMEHLVQLFRYHLGNKVVLFTTDGSNREMLKKGSLMGETVLTVGDGCTDIEAAIKAQNEMNPIGKSPFICTETYTGWLTHWGEPAAQTPAAALKLVESILKAGSVSLYMAHGGTNFGFYSGSNYPSYLPDLTSYDYNAPISENGDAGIGKDGLDKFQVLSKYFSLYNKVSKLPDRIPRYNYGVINLTESVNLLEHFSVLSEKQIQSHEPLHAESYGCHFGWIAYQWTVSKTFSNLNISKFQDRVMVFANNQLAFSKYRADFKISNSKSSYAFSGMKVGDVLTILVEQMGRVNFNKEGMADTRFGLLGPVLFDGEPRTDWRVFCLDFKNPDFEKIRWVPSGVKNVGPLLYRGILQVEKKGDTYLNTGMLGKGIVFVNGFNIGRYWTQQLSQGTLYLPAPLLRIGKNEIVVLETDVFASSPRITSQLQPDFYRPDSLTELA